MYKCKFCEKEFETKQKLGGHSVKEHTKFHPNKYERVIIKKICPKCGKEFGVEHKKERVTGDITPLRDGKKFCSRKCANSKQWTEQQRIERSISAKSSDKVKSANAIKRYKRTTR